MICDGTSVGFNSLAATRAVHMRLIARHTARNSKGVCSLCAVACMSTRTTAGLQRLNLSEEPIGSLRHRRDMYSATVQGREHKCS